MSSDIARFLAENGFVTAEALDRPSFIESFLGEISRALAGEKSSLQMIRSYLKPCGGIPSGKKVSVLDAGGTNLRSAVVTVPGGVSHLRKQPMPGTLGEVSREEFFRILGDEVRLNLAYVDDDRIGFCFSYDAEVTPDLDACLRTWNKGIRAPEVVGRLVGRELASELGRGSVVVVNDTVTTLLAAKAQEIGRGFDTYVGFILGTGLNAAYPEPMRGGEIFNTEAGGFDALPQSAFDRAMDARQPDTGAFPLEKMSAGAYLGPLALEVFRGAADAGLLDLCAARGLEGLETLSTVELDAFVSGDMTVASGSPLERVFSSNVSRQRARELGLAVFQRAAALAGLVLSATVIRAAGPDGRLSVAVNVDGSTYYKSRSVSFSQAVGHELDAWVRSRGIAVEVLPQIPDSPLLGAAVAAML